jgi:hypothetical protein
MLNEWKWLIIWNVRGTSNGLIIMCTQLCIAVNFAGMRASAYIHILAYMCMFAGNSKSYVRVSGQSSMRACVGECACVCFCAWV